MKLKEEIATSSGVFHRVLSMDREVLVELGQRLDSQIPNAAEHIHRHLCEDPLHDMCSEYEECLHSLRHWEKSQSKHTLRIREYTELLGDLEKEILAYLKTLVASDGPSSSPCDDCGESP